MGQTQGQGPFLFDARGLCQPGDHPQLRFGRPAHQGLGQIQNTVHPCGLSLHDLLRRHVADLAFRSPHVDNASALRHVVPHAGREKGIVVLLLVWADGDFQLVGIQLERVSVHNGHHRLVVGAQKVADAAAHRRRREHEPRRFLAQLFHWVFDGLLDEIVLVEPVREVVLERFHQQLLASLLDTEVDGFRNDVAIVVDDGHLGIDRLFFEVDRSVQHGVAVQLHRRRRASLVQNELLDRHGNERHAFVTIVELPAHNGRDDLDAAIEVHRVQLEFVRDAGWLDDQSAHSFHVTVPDVIHQLESRTQLVLVGIHESVERLQVLVVLGPGLDDQRRLVHPRHFLVDVVNAQLTEAVLQPAFFFPFGPALVTQEVEAQFVVAVRCHHELGRPGPDVVQHKRGRNHDVLQHLGAIAVHGRSGFQHHADVEDGRHDEEPVDDVVVEHRRRFATEVRDEHRLARERRGQALPHNLGHRGSDELCERFALHGIVFDTASTFEALHPVPLLLERVRRKRHAPAVATVFHGHEVHFDTVAVQLGETSHAQLPVTRAIALHIGRRCPHHGASVGHDALRHANRHRRRAAFHEAAEVVLDQRRDGGVELHR